MQRITEGPRIATMVLAMGITALGVGFLFGAFFTGAASVLVLVICLAGVIAVLRMETHRLAQIVLRQEDATRAMIRATIDMQAAEENQER